MHFCGFRSNVKMRKSKVDVLVEYRKMNSAGQKDLINLVVVGHVDSQECCTNMNKNHEKLASKVLPLLGF
jgi:hypothetical protein